VKADLRFRDPSFRLAGNLVRAFVGLSWFRILGIQRDVKTVGVSAVSAVNIVTVENPALPNSGGLSKIAKQ
jgi:hypothetical protein